jgi:hypothetical protein
MLLTLAGAVGLQSWVYQPFMAHYFPSRTTNTYSKQFKTDADKIQFLKRYLVFPSAIEAAEFHVIYYDNSDLAAFSISPVR